MTFRRRRLEFTAETKRLAYHRSASICECHRIPWLRRPSGCAVKLSDGNTFYEHINPDNIRPDNSLENSAVLCRACWREKTDTYDRPVIAKANHTRDRARNIKPRSFSPLPGGRDDDLMKTMSGKTVLRATREPWRPGR